MMRRNVETTVTARVCQVASLLAILGMVLGVLAHDAMYGSGSSAERTATRVVVGP
jgi:hypothetical protein